MRKREKKAQTINVITNIHRTVGELQYKKIIKTQNFIQYYQDTKLYTI